MTTSTERTVDMEQLRRIGEAINLDWAAAMAEVEDEGEPYGLVYLIDDIQAHIANELADMRRALLQEAELRDPSIQLTAAMQVIEDFIAEGKLIRLEGGSIIEAERYDPAVHIPAAVAETRREETRRTLAGETDEIEAIADAEFAAFEARNKAAWLAAPGDRCNGCGVPTKRKWDDEHGLLELCLNPDCTYDK